MNKNSKAVKLFLSLSMVTAITACNNPPEQSSIEEDGALLTDNVSVSVEQQPNLILANDGQESGEQADDGQESGEQADDGQESGESQESGEQGEGQESGEADKVKKLQGNQ